MEADETRRRGEAGDINMGNDTRLVKVVCGGSEPVWKVIFNGLIMLISLIGGSGVTIAIGYFTINYIQNNIHNTLIVDISACADAASAGAVADPSVCNDILTIIGSVETEIPKRQEDRIVDRVNDAIEDLKLTDKAPETPLILAGSDMRLKRGPARRCGQFDWTIEYAPNGNDWNAIAADKLFDPDAAGQINLPKFCGPDGRASWVLLDQPRVYYSVSSAPKRDGAGKIIRDDEGEVAEWIHERAPYVMFVAMEERSRRIANAYFIYIDALSARPNMIEISFESLRQKPLISLQGNTQLVSNLKLDSNEREITFQIGARSQGMTIAGYDFGADPREGNRAGPVHVDTSGAYYIELNQAGAVEMVGRK